ncbi:MAG: putative rane protein [Methylobacteriaceae bacterium]|jgi:putative membrane protein|nr:putative rane protein [Methylobacteriaceae bacterium]
MAITPEDRARIAEAIRAAEANTSGEIVCVLARSSSEYTAAPVLVGATLALLVPWAFVLLTQWSVQRILIAQLIIFVLATLICASTPIGMTLVPRRIKRTRAHRAAMEQFHARGLGRLESRAGVLIFVSLAERYARIVVDDHLSTKVHVREWRAAVDALTSHVKDGRVGKGFVAAIARCGAVLAEHAPGAPSGRLPDRIYVM